MKIMGVTMGIIISAIVIVAIYLSLNSRKLSSPGVVDGRLRSCPETPNCVCSEFPKQDWFVEPLTIEGDFNDAWDRAKSAVRDTGGRIVLEGKDYIAATYTSPVFRFVDDLELRLDVAEQKIHLRSASRVGYSDLGVNRKRIERLRLRYMALSRI